MSTEFHPEKNGLCDNSNKTVVQYLRGFATWDQAKWNAYLPLAEHPYNSSVHRSKKHKPIHLAPGYEPPVSQRIIADLQYPQDKESAETSSGCKYVERLQRMY
jgi:hypothetical protein